MSSLQDHSRQYMEYAKTHPLYDTLQTIPDVTKPSPELQVFLDMRTSLDERDQGLFFLCMVFITSRMGWKGSTQSQWLIPYITDLRDLEVEVYHYCLYLLAEGCRNVPPDFWLLQEIQASVHEMGSDRDLLIFSWTIANLAANYWTLQDVDWIIEHLKRFIPIGMPELQDSLLVAIGNLLLNTHQPLDPVLLSYVYDQSLEDCLKPLNYAIVVERLAGNLFTDPYKLSPRWKQLLNAEDEQLVIKGYCTIGHILYRASCKTLPTYDIAYITSLVLQLDSIDAEELQFAYIRALFSLHRLGHDEKELCKLLKKYINHGNEAIKESFAKLLVEDIAWFPLQPDKPICKIHHLLFEYKRMGGIYSMIYYPRGLAYLIMNHVSHIEEYHDLLGNLKEFREAVIEADNLGTLAYIDAILMLAMFYQVDSPQHWLGREIMWLKQYTTANIFRARDFSRLMSRRELQSQLSDKFDGEYIHELKRILQL